MHVIVYATKVIYRSVRNAQWNLVLDIRQIYVKLMILIMGERDSASFAFQAVMSLTKHSNHASSNMNLALRHNL